METPAGVVRDSAFFLNVKNLKVKTARKLSRSTVRVSAFV